jgi:hypothetical protein
VELELLQIETETWPSEMAKVGRVLMKQAGQPLKSADMRRGFWRNKTHSQFPRWAAAANKLISVHATAAAAERNWSVWGRIYQKNRASLKIENAQKLVYIRANLGKDGSDSEDEDLAQVLETAMA